MAQRHKSWIAFFIKIMMIVIMGHLWISEAFAGSEKGNKTTETITEYYWVGGSGNWSDLSHWATSSGGSEKHEFLPNQYSNVHFDENSFTAEGQEVILDIEEVTCRDMIWEGQLDHPLLKGDHHIDSIDANIYGSLKFDKRMNISDSKLNFNLTASSGKHYITSSGQPFHSKVFTKSEDVTYELTDSLIAINLIFNQGKLITNGHFISARTIRFGTYAEIILGSSQIEFFERFVIHGKVDFGTSKIIGRKSNEVDELYFQTASGTDTNFQINKLELLGSANLDLGIAQANEILGHEKINLTMRNQISKVTLLDDAILDLGIGYPTAIDTLILSPAKSYLFSQKSSLKIDSLNAVGTCDKPITIMSESEQLQYVNSFTTFVKESGSINLQYVNLTNIQADGGANFTGQNVVAHGNVSGWTLDSNLPKDLYWVGGSGDWNDSNHWSGSSGGFGGKCVPMAHDNVIFDENSFPESGQIITCNSNISVHNMDWSNVSNYPELIFGNDKTWNIHGSLKLSSKMQLENKLLLVNFLADQSNVSIKSSGQNFAKSAYFNGNQSTWSLTDSLIVEKDIIVYNGKVITNDNNLNARALFVIKQGEVLMGNSTIRLKNRFTACSTYDAGTSNLYIGDSDQDYDGPTGTIYTAQDLYNVYFTGVRGKLFTDERLAPYFIEFPQDCKINPPDSLRVNNLVFYNDAELFNTGTTIVGNKLEILGDSKIHGKYGIDSILFASGSINYLDTSSFKFANLDINGTCGAYTELKGGYFEPSKQTTIEFCILDNVSGSDAQLLTASNSADIGNNTGWTFTEPEVSTLYWVGNGGSWSDPNHWSKVSGGVGGNCIPNIYSDVHFDSNSFTSDDQKVIIDVERANFKSMDWTGVAFNPTLEGDTATMIRCSGSLILTPDMTWNYRGNSIEFLSNSMGEIINLAGYELLSNVYFYGENGEWILQSDFKNRGLLWLYDGIFDTDGFRVETERLISSQTITPYIGEEPLSILRLNDSDFILIDGNQETRADFNSLTDAGTSTIILPKGGRIATFSDLYDVVTLGPTMFFISEEHISKNFHNLTFGSWGQISMVENDPPAVQSFNKITFLEGGNLTGTPFSIDSLILSAGNEYEIGWFARNTEHKLTIRDHLDIRGTSCAPITIKNSVTYGDIPVNINKSSGIISGTFLKLKNIQVGGGAKFYAGANSEDLGGNDGWIFENAPREYGFLGEDKTLTAGFPVPLNAIHYGNNIEYLWNTGETTSAIKAKSCGEYSVQVFLDQGCMAYDTVNISSTGAVDEGLIQKTINANCFEKGVVVLNPEMLSNALNGYSVLLINQNSKDTTALADGENKFTNLDPATYLLQADDLQGCLSLLDKELKIEKDTGIIPPDFLISTRHSDCNDGGQIEIDRSQILDLTSPLNIYLINQDNGNKYTLTNDESIFFNLPEGEYHLHVEDSSGCLSLFLEELIIDPYSDELPSEILAQVSDADCKEEGKVFINSSVPLNIYSSYIFLLSNLETEQEYQLIKGSSTFSDLPHGTYELTTLDSDGCTKKYPDEILINRLNSELPSAFLENVSTPTCNLNGFIEINRSTVQYILPPYEVQLINLSTNQKTTLAPNQSTFSDLPADSYELLVKDAAGCLSILPDKITLEPYVHVLPANVLEDVVDANCENTGQVVIDSALQLNIPTSYTFVLSNLETDQEYQLDNTSSSFLNIPHGLYELKTLDSEGCEKQYPEEIEIELLNSSLPSEFFVKSKDATCAQKGEITIDRSAIDNVAAPYSITLTSAFSGSELVLVESDSVFVNLTEDTYILTVIDSAGCVYDYTDDIIINLDESGCGSSIISPDFGESLTVPFQGKVNIYNRNGGLVRTFDAPGEWDGTDSRGQTVPIGVYILIADGNRDQIIQVTVVR